mmetsp:Transcript_132969/g.231112  ORF Transcript_132969/g.231112 Transcript_132969/m.231112 type:complete len:161 (+) Transcript_132969:52-534(+)
MWFGEINQGAAPPTQGPESPDSRWEAASASSTAESIKISGVYGMFGDTWTNGTYELEPQELPTQTPAWTMQDAIHERWLYFDAENRWRVGGHEYKLKRLASAGSMRSAPVEPGTLPSTISEWEVRTGYAEWQMQEASITAMQATPVPKPTASPPEGNSEA